MSRRPPSSTLFPYTTLFRSARLPGASSCSTLRMEVSVALRTMDRTRGRCRVARASRSTGRFPRVESTGGWIRAEGGGFGARIHAHGTDKPERAEGAIANAIFLAAGVPALLGRSIGRVAAALSSLHAAGPDTAQALRR